MIYAGKNLFKPDTETAVFPFCSVEDQMEPYFVRNATTSNESVGTPTIVHSPTRFLRS
ncbi:hypothetical protein DVH05_020283 [Phytophthora capsici]|nr:hypothetical protein DVH05_020283 [Phytophthora capsici]